MGRGEGGSQLSDVLAVFAALGSELLSAAADQGAGGCLGVAGGRRRRAASRHALRSASTCGAGQGAGR